MKRPGILAANPRACSLLHACMASINRLRDARPITWPLLAAATLLLMPQTSYGHQQPTTIVVLDVRPGGVGMELQVPLSELELAFGHSVSTNPTDLLDRLGASLSTYLVSHIHPAALDGRPWSVSVANMMVGQAEQTQSGPYQEITFRLLLTPPAGATNRTLVLNYDVILHQVVTHKAIVSLHDWETGRIDNGAIALGTISVDTRSGRIFPLRIEVGEGSARRGFANTVVLGFRHIQDGTDHLLFLLMLLLPSTLVAGNGRWQRFGGLRYSLRRLLVVVSAFTIGHSTTLLIGVLTRRQMPQQPVEVLIAASILFSAIHAIRPIFPCGEKYVAGTFGLVHGLAFATALAGLDLSAGQMALSVFGFNLGIELMQLFVIALTIPWLMLMSSMRFYRLFRVAAALLASIAAVAWIVERVSGTPNAISGLVQDAGYYPHIGVFVLAFATALGAAMQRLQHSSLYWLPGSNSVTN
jgi:hypothetical protein